MHYANRGRRVTVKPALFSGIGNWQQGVIFLKKFIQ
jgi:hypothetical protein